MDRRNFLAGAVAASAGYNAVRDGETKGEFRQAQYAIVELLGHKKLAGRIMQGVSGLLQLDVPVPGGHVTQMINPASIYRLTIVDAKTVAEFSKYLDPLPAIELEVGTTQRRLTFGDPWNDDDEDDWHN